MTANHRDARIYTDCGWVKAPELCEGMNVLTPQGALVPVVQTYRQRSRNFCLTPLRGLPFICDASEALPMTGFDCHEKRNRNLDVFEDYLMVTPSHLSRLSPPLKRSYFLSRGLLGKGYDHDITIADKDKIIYAIQAPGQSSALAVRLIVLCSSLSQMDSLHFSLRTQGYISWMHTSVPAPQGSEFVIYGSSAPVGKHILCLEILGDFSRFFPSFAHTILAPCKYVLNLPSKDKTPIRRIQDAGTGIMFCFKTLFPCLYMTDGLVIRRS